MNNTGAGSKSYSFGVFLYMSPQKIEQVWSPLVLFISQEIGVSVQLRMRASYSAFKNEIERECFDIAFMRLFVYANVAFLHGYIPLSRFVSLRDVNRKGMLKAIFVTLKENRHIKLSGLKGKVITPPPFNTAVTISGKNFLLKHGLKAGRNYQLSTQSNHQPVLGSQSLIVQHPLLL